MNGSDVALSWDAIGELEQLAAAANYPLHAPKGAALAMYQAIEQAKRWSHEDWLAEKQKLANAWRKGFAVLSGHTQ